MSPGQPLRYGVGPGSLLGAIMGVVVTDTVPPAHCPLGGASAWLPKPPRLSCQESGLWPLRLALLLSS